MKRNRMTSAVLVALVAGGLTACEGARSTAPNAEVAFATSSAAARFTPRDTARARPGVDTARCRPEDALTPAQIEAIRALWEDYYNAVGDLLRYIAEIEKEAREAAAAGVTPEGVARILAQADDAKRLVAEAQKRLREAIDAVLSEDQRRHHCAADPLPAVPK